MVGIVGLVIGDGVGAQIIKRGYSLGRSRPTERAVSGWMLPAAAVGLLALAVAGFSKLGPDVGEKMAPHAPLWISLAAGLVVGGVAQRSRFCTMGALRDLFIVRDMHLLLGIVAFTVTAFVLNLVLGQFHAGFVGQPAAHNQHIWNVLGMALSGLCFVLAGGCPGRQLILAGEKGVVNQDLDQYAAIGRDDKMVQDHGANRIEAPQEGLEIDALRCRVDRAQAPVERVTTRIQRDLPVIVA
mgnify:CR=1 FL=1